ncbi:NAD(P)-binding protein [Fusarium heterosporum]|uniref:NAD(P)-binding protein n=1 Tax=Fusarium heterosporum TaxID=42747 RepID=A0A8H5WZC0_FUSHE|nr:NAD(P)-binding protein [Fusarium heterosporum]
MSFTPDQSLLTALVTKTVIVTGGANGIGLEAIRKYHANGANVVIADLPSARSAAEAAIRTLEDDATRALFVPVNIADFDDVAALFTSTIKRFGCVDIVVANAGIMESRKFFDFHMDEEGHLIDDGSSRVIDVNLKGTINTLRHAVFNMRMNPPDQDGWRGSVVLISSTSGYTGGTEVVSYVSSKHGVIGLLRSSHGQANRLGVRVSAVAPFITPTFITKGYSESWKAEGLPTNTAEEVATGIVHMSLDVEMQGKCCLVAGGRYREVEGPMAKALSVWTGDMSEVFRKAGQFFQRLGGYPLPEQRS